MHDEVNSALDLNLTDIIFDTDNKDTINLTQNTQPAIMLTSYTIFTVLKKKKELILAILICAPAILWVNIQLY